MTMIERVAAAIAQAMIESPHYDSEGRSVQQEVEAHRASYIPAAIAAIEAMRDPTDGLKEAGSYFNYANEEWGDPAEEAGKCYSAMIDAALEGK